MKKNIFTLFILAFLVACESEKQPLEFTNYAIERHFKDCNPDLESCTFIDLNYPVANKKREEAKIINREIANHIIKIIDYREDATVENLEQLADRFITNYENTSADFPDSETPWEASVYGEVQYFGEELISIKFTSELFTGGAHGYGSESFLNFNPENGELYKNKELFTSGFKDFVEKEFRKEKEIPVSDPINSTGLFFEDEQFHLPYNIGFSEGKVILHYNAYEIASYAEGAFRMEFSQEEVAQFLRIEL